MPPGRKPIDPNIRIAKTWSGSKPTPCNGPLARALRDEVEAKQLAERLAELKAVTERSKDKR
jgi:hypothetical protein